MKRLLSFLLALALLLSAPLFAVTAEDGDDSDPVPIDAAEEGDDSDPMPIDTEEEGDDSNPIPVDMMEDEDLEIEEEILQGRVLQYGDHGDDVLALQTRLKDLKYYTGNLSGRYREGTRKAVETFQADFDLDQTGVADLRTLSILFSLTHRPLRFGSSGEDVKQLQIQLTELGYYKGKISGNYLDSTQNAVEELQKKNDLEVTGVADSDLQDMLLEGKLLSKSEKPSDTNTPAPDLANYLVDDSENSVPMPDQPVEFTKKLKSGSRGKLVKDLQERLTELGYYEGPISGNFMKYTVRAVKAIQTQNGLESTGVVDEATWNVIFNDARIEDTVFRKMILLVRGLHMDVEVRIDLLFGHALLFPLLLIVIRKPALCLFLPRFFVPCVFRGDISFAGSFDLRVLYRHLFFRHDGFLRHGRFVRALSRTVDVRSLVCAVLRRVCCRCAVFRSVFVRGIAACRFRCFLHCRSRIRCC